MFHPTLAHIDAFTDSLEFERMCVDLLKRAGFDDTTPRGPDRPDGGIDAYSLRYPRGRVFQFSLAKSWHRKLLATCAQITKPEQPLVDQRAIVLFITTASVSPRASDGVAAQAGRQFGLRVRILDREWLRSELDRHQDIRRQYLGLPVDAVVAPRGDVRTALTFVDDFSLVDFAHHVFTLVIRRHKPYASFLRRFLTERIVPLIYSPSPSTRARLFPEDDGSSEPKGFRQHHPITGAPVYEPLKLGATQPHDVRVFIERKPDLDESAPRLVSVLGGILVVGSNRLSNHLGRAELVLVYMSTLLTQLSREWTRLHPGATLDVEAVRSIQWRAARVLIRQIARRTVREGTLADVADGLEYFYSLSHLSPDGFVPNVFLEAVPVPEMRRLLTRASNNEFSRAVELLADRRTPPPLARAVLGEINVRGPDEIDDGERLLLFFQDASA